MNSIPANLITALPAQELKICAIEAVTPFDFISVTALVMLLLRFRRIADHVTGATYLCLHYLFFLGGLSGSEHMTAVAALIAGIMAQYIVPWQDSNCLQKSCGLLSLCSAYLCRVVGQPDTDTTELLVLQIAFAIFDLIAENPLVRDLRKSRQFALPSKAIPNGGYADTVAENSGLHPIEGLSFKKIPLSISIILG